MADEWVDIAVGPPVSAGDEWVDVAAGPPIAVPEASFGDRFKANLVQAANTVFPFADEAAAGVRSVLPGYGGYDEELAAIRQGQAEHAGANPYEAGVSSVIGALASAPFLPSAVGQRSTLAGKLAQAAAEGAGYGAFYGAGSAKEGERLEAGLDSAKIGAITGPVATLLGEGVKTAGGKLAQGGRALARKAFGARQSDYAKSANRIGMILDVPEDEIGTFTKKTLDEFAQSGELGASRDPARLYAIAAHNERALEKEIGGTVAAFDEIVGSPVTPEFANAERMIADGRIPGDKIPGFTRRLKQLRANIEENPTLSYVQAQKVALGKDWVPDDGVRNEFTRAIYSDLQKTVEQAVPQVKALNGELRRYKVLMPILERGVASDEASTGIARFIQGIRTSGGGGVPLIAGAISGHPYLGAGVTAGLMAAQSPRGYAVGGKLLERAGEAAISASGGAGRLGVISAPNLAAQIRSQTEESSLRSGQKVSNTSPSGTDKSEQAGKPPLPPQIVDAQFLEPRSEDQKTTGGRLPSDNSAPNIFELQPESSIFDVGIEPTNIFEVDGMENKISDELLDAVRMVESGGGKYVDGPETKYGTAKGPYQLLDSTGRELHKKLKIKDEYNPYDEKQSRKIAKAYLEELLDEFGSVELALTAYHTGRGNVKAGKIGPQGRAYAPKILGLLKA